MRMYQIVFIFVCLSRAGTASLPLPPPTAAAAAAPATPPPNFFSWSPDFPAIAEATQEERLDGTSILAVGGGSQR